MLAGTAFTNFGSKMLGGMSCPWVVRWEESPPLFSLLSLADPESKPEARWKRSGARGNPRGLSWEAPRRARYARAAAGTPRLPGVSARPRLPGAPTGGATPRRAPRGSPREPAPSFRPPHPRRDPSVSVSACAMRPPAAPNRPPICKTA